MIFALILGIIVGAVAVIFVLQNVAIVTVSFLYWHITASLALVLVGSMAAAAVVLLLILLPNLIRDEMSLSSIKRRNKELEEEMAKVRAASVAGTIPPGTPVQVTGTVA